MCIGAGNHLLTARRADRAIELLYEHDGAFPPPDSDADPAAAPDFQVTMETPFETRYFIVQLSAQQEVLSVDTDHIAALDRQTVVECVSDILLSGKSSGYSGYYRFGIFQDAQGGSTIIVLDCFLQLQSVYHMLRITLLVSAACLLLVLLFLSTFSGRAVRPFAENLERQRRFVTDASHELKTPLAILSADLGLLEGEGEKNRWLQSAKNQLVRMERLVGEMMELARAEEGTQGEAMELFSLSEVVSASADAFQPLVEAAGKQLQAVIQPGVMIQAVKENMFRLLSVLLDNAVKYCDEGGTVQVTLSSRGRQAILSVSNPCAGLDVSQMPRFFDRFYRADASRARHPGGYGIGLSIAQAIVGRYKGRLGVRYNRGAITFSATFPSTGSASGSRRAWPPGWHSGVRADLDRRTRCKCADAAEWFGLSPPEQCQQQNNQTLFWPVVSHRQTPWLARRTAPFC